MGRPGVNVGAGVEARGGGLRNAGTFEQELGGFPAFRAAARCRCSHLLPGRRGLRVGRPRETHIHHRFGHDLERGVREVQEQPGHRIAEVVQALAAPCRHGGRMERG